MSENLCDTGDRLEFRVPVAPINPADGIHPPAGHPDPSRGRFLDREQFPLAKFPCEVLDCESALLPDAKRKACVCNEDSMLRHPEVMLEEVAHARLERVQPQIEGLFESGATHGLLQVAPLVIAEKRARISFLDEIENGLKALQLFIAGKYS